MSQPVAIAPISLDAHRAAKVANARPVGRRALTPDMVEEHLQAGLKSREPKASRAERRWLLVALLGCVLCFGALVFLLLNH